jgi:PAS domain S-box-containing protein
MIEMRKFTQTVFRLDQSHRPAMRQVIAKLMVLAVLMLVVGSIPALPGLHGVAGYEPLHTLLETISIIVSGLIFAVIWTAPHRNVQGNMMLLACAFAAVAVLDFCHLLSIQGMPDFVTPSSPEKAINFWLSARLIAALALFGFAVRDWKKRDSSLSRYGVLAGLMLMAAMIGTLILFYPEVMPRTFVKGQGLTDFKRAAEFGLIGLNVGAMVLLFMRMRGPLSFNAAAIFGAIGAMAMSEFFFTLYADVTDIYLVVGHVYKIISYLFLYQAVFVETIERPYVDLQLSKDQLAMNRALIEAVVDGSPSVIYGFDTSGRFLLVNKTFEQLFGVSRAHLMGRTRSEALAGIMPRSVAEEHAKNDQLVMASGQSYEVEEHNEEPDGTHIYLTQKHPLRDANGHIFGIAGSSTDITERKNTEDLFRRNEERRSVATDSGRVAIWEVNLDTEKLIWDDNCFVLYQMSPDTFTGSFEEWISHVHPDDRDATILAFQNTVAGTQDYHLTFRIRWPSGEVRHIEAHGRVIEDGERNARYMIGTNWDITDQKRAEELLEMALQEKTALLLEVHHRVKNNLQVITSLLRLEGFRSENEATKTVLKDMQGRIRAMALLHETIYRKGNFAAIDLGSYISQIAGESIRNLQITPGAVQLRLDVGVVQVGLDQATPCGLMISEMISNCLKHGFPDGRQGEIDISLQLFGEGEANQWRLKVSDTGVGLAADFETKRQKSLGLQLVDDLSKQMGGTLHIGNGPEAVFSVNFTAEVPTPIQINLATENGHDGK